MNLRSASVTMLLGGLALLLVAALGWFLLIGPTVGRLADVGERKTAAVDRSSTMSLQLASLRKQAENLPDTRREAAEIALALPATADQPGFFAAVSDAARGAGIRADQITDISQGVPQLVDDDASTGESDVTVPEAIKGAQVALQLVTVSVEADYRRLTRLIRNIESMDRVLFMTGVDLTTEVTTEEEAGRGDALKLTLTGVAVIAPPIEDPDDVEQSSTGGDATGGDTEQASG